MSSTGSEPGGDPFAPPSGVPAHGPPPQGVPPHGVPPYGTPPPYGPPPGSTADSVRAQAITALIANLVSVFLCCGLLSIAGAACAALALSQADQDPAGSRRRVRWAWGLLAGSIAMTVLAVAGAVTYLIYKGAV